MAVKLAFTSDLHWPFMESSVLSDLGRAVADFAPDALAVLGDIGESLADIETCLKSLRESVRCPVLVVAGNHDIWLPKGGAGQGSSLVRFQKELPEAVTRAGCDWLEGTAFVKEGIAVAGTIAWYDYSAADPSIQATAETFVQQKGKFNMDAHRVHWPCTDLQFAELVARPFLETLDRLEADPTVRQVVVVTHVPLLDCQMCRRPENPDWAFSNAYFGNLTLGEQVIQRKKVSHIVSGHTHVGRHAMVKLTDGRTIEARVLDSQYGGARLEQHHA